jgi:guanylate kinase
MNVPRLRKLEEFKAALVDYRISDASLKVLKKTKIVLLLGPTSAGRNTIIWELVNTGDYHFIVSDTTRPKRVNDGVEEQDGVEYWFRSEDEILDDILKGNYLEAELIHGQQISGISIRELKEASDQKKIAINEVDLGGMQAVVRAKPDTFAIMVLPPSFAQWQKRLKTRGNMGPDEYRRRMQTARRIFLEAISSDYFKFIVNDDIKRASLQIDKLAKTGKVDSKEQERGIKLAEELYEETDKLLKNES